jgi:hypothetical protein
VPERSLRIRLVARLRRRTLDRELAEGRNPRTTPELALRATQLTSPQARRRLAQAFRGTVAEAVRSTQQQPTPAISPNRRAVLACRPELEDLAERLVTLEHPRPRGVAIARRLLVDGGGPLYLGRAHRLANVVDTARRALGTGHSLA